MCYFKIILFLVSICVGILTGCASYEVVPADYTLDKNVNSGLLVMSLTISGKRAVPIRLLYRGLDPENRKISGKIPFDEDPKTHDWHYDSKDTVIPRGQFFDGKLVVFNLPPGNYEFYGVTIQNGYLVAEYDWGIIDNFSKKFHIDAKKANYAGNIHFWFKHQEEYFSDTISFERSHNNESQRDIPLFYKKFPKIKEEQISFSTFLLSPIDAQSKALPGNIPKAYKEALSLKPHDAEAHKNRAKIYKELKLYKKAMLHANQSIKLKPKFTAAYELRAEIHMQQKRFKKALADLNMAIKLGDNIHSEEIYFHRGEAKRKLQDHQGAINDYSKAIEINPKYANAYNNRGVAKRKLQDHQGAINDYSKAIEIKPKHALAYRNRCWTKQKISDYSGAIKDCNRAIKLKPKYAKAYMDRCRIKRETGNYSGAITDCDRAIEIKPNYAPAYFNRGFVKARSGDNQGAISDYSKAIEIKPKYSNAYNNRCWTKQEMGDFDGAMIDCNRSLELAPDYAAAYDSRGVVKHKKGDLDGAIADFNRAIELKPN